MEKKQCIRCGKFKIYASFVKKTDHCKTCDKPQPKNRHAQFYMNRQKERDREQRRAVKLSGEVKTSYVCICARNPDSCKAEQHS